MNRRRFLKLLGMAGAAAAIPWKFDWRRGLVDARAYAYSLSPIIPKFVDSLPGLTAAGANNLGNYLTVMTADTATFPGSDYYKMVAAQSTQKMHTNLPATPFWSYAQDNGVAVATDQKYLGGVIVANANKPVRVTMRNNLPATHILPVDQTLPMWNGFMGGATGVNRMSVHLHGGFPPWISDGTPFQDFGTAGNGYGPSTGFPPDMPAPTITPPGSYSYYWTNQQTARFLWFHDHAMDLTRLNAYAGLATGYVITDAVEASMQASAYLPAAAQTVYLVLQDKTFNADGTMWYPSKYEWSGATGRWAWAGDPALVPPVPHPNNPTDPFTLPVSCVPEAFFDNIVINGTVSPYLQVKRQHYRFRILNGSQAWVYNLQLYIANSLTPKEVTMVPANGATYTGPYGSVTVPNDARPGGVPDPTTAGPIITQIGTECGFLNTPVNLNNPPKPIDFDANPLSPTFGNATAYTLVLAPAERCDIIIDFSTVPDNTNIILYNDAPAPFPMGDPRNDYFTGDPDQTASGGAPSTLAGSGPNTRTLMQFRVRGNPATADPASMDTLKNLATTKTPAPFIPTIAPLDTKKVVKTRRLTLNETFDFGTMPAYPLNYGRLIQMLGTDVVQGVDPYGTPIFYQSYEQGRGEVVHRGTTEIWEIINLTGDTHPIHFHLVNVQVLNRQVFDDVGYLAAGGAAAPGTKIDVTPYLIGAPRPADDNELGWKETVRMNPHEVTRVIARFDLPTLPWPIPNSTRLCDPMSPPGPNNPRINGHEYVWHCHILEHEEHDMMHALTVVNPGISGARKILLQD